MHVHAEPTALKISLSIIIFFSPFWLFKYSLYLLNVTLPPSCADWKCGSLILLEASGPLSAWLYIFYLINIPDKVLDNGGPWRILVALNFGIEWMRVIGSCSGHRTTQVRTHHIDRLAWYHSLVERCTLLFCFTSQYSKHGRPVCIHSV
jgi:hypothetical protein